MLPTNTINQPINQSTNQAVNQSTNQLISQSTNQSTNHRYIKLQVSNNVG